MSFSFFCQKFCHHTFHWNFASECHSMALGLFPTQILWCCDVSNCHWQYSITVTHTTYLYTNLHNRIHEHSHPSSQQTITNAHTLTHTHAHKHARTRAHTQTQYRRSHKRTQTKARNGRRKIHEPMLTHTSERTQTRIHGWWTRNKGKQT